MKPDSILTADILDIIFENKNKTYGAYELRSHYNARLKKALLIIFICVAVLLFINWLSTHGKPHIGFALKGPDVEFTEIDMHPPKETVKPLQVQKRKLTTVKFTVPLIVNHDRVNPPPTVEAVAQKQIDIKNTIGEKSGDGDVPQPSTGQAGNGKDIIDQPEAKEAPVYFAEIMPEFPGGMEALKRFLSKNLRVPEDIDPGANVRVLARFVVDKEGEINGIELLQRGGEDFDAEVIRVMKKMPRWKPGMQNGNLVAVYFTLPVIFQSPE